MLFQEISPQVEIVTLFINEICLVLQNMAIFDNAIIFLPDLMIVRSQVFIDFSEFLIIKEDYISLFCLISVSISDKNIVLSEMLNLLLETLNLFLLFVDSFHHKLQFVKGKDLLE